MRTLKTMKSDRARKAGEENFTLGRISGIHGMIYAALKIPNLPDSVIVPLQRALAQAFIALQNYRFYRDGQIAQRQKHIQADKILKKARKENETETKVKANG